jgi:hypothetical protein
LAIEVAPDEMSVNPKTAAISPTTKNTNDHESINPPLIDLKKCISRCQQSSLNEFNNNQGKPDSGIKHSLKL